ncbi:hypothetical protein NL676_039828 [Syzygium grande]|nr:hypothetical protein NL676_039828 [Syzygium grande]
MVACGQSQRSRLLSAGSYRGDLCAEQWKKGTACGGGVSRLTYSETHPPTPCWSEPSLSPWDPLSLSSSLATSGKLAENLLIVPSVEFTSVFPSLPTSQTRFRALKHENGIAGNATIIVRVIACFQPLQDCQAEYFRHLLNPQAISHFYYYKVHQAVDSCSNTFLGNCLIRICQISNSTWDIQVLSRPEKWWPENGSIHRCVLAWSPFFWGHVRWERERGVRLELVEVFDLLRWLETPPPHDSVAHGSASSLQCSLSAALDGISKVVFGGQVTAEESENLNNRKPCSGYKLKEITGSGIFAANGEDDLLEPGSANPALNNKTGLKMYQS